MATAPVVELLEAYRVSDHGVVDVRAVLDELIRRHKDPVAELVAVFSDPDAYQWRLYALVGLRTLATEGHLQAPEAHMVLEMTDLVAPYAGLDEYYKTITALAASRQTAPVLLDFIRACLDRKAPYDWRWLAFAAMGALLAKQTVTVPWDLAKALSEEAPNERDPHRRTQMEEVATMAFRTT